MEEELEQEEEPNFERTEVWITKKLLESMEKFDNPKFRMSWIRSGLNIWCLDLWNFLHGDNV